MIMSMPFPSAPIRMGASFPLPRKTPTAPPPSYLARKLPALPIRISPRCSCTGAVKKSPSSMAERVVIRSNTAPSCDRRSGRIRVCIRVCAKPGTAGLETPDRVPPAPERFTSAMSGRRSFRISAAITRRWPHQGLVLDRIDRRTRAGRDGLAAMFQRDLRHGAVQEGQQGLLHDDIDPAAALADRLD